MTRPVSAMTCLMIVLWKIMAWCNHEEGRILAHPVFSLNTKCSISRVARAADGCYSWMDPNKPSKPICSWWLMISMIIDICLKSHEPDPCKIILKKVLGYSIVLRKLDIQDSLGILQTNSVGFG